MSRLNGKAALFTLLALGMGIATLGQTPPSPLKQGSTATTTTSSGIMQLKKQITGDFSYRFVSTADKTAAAATSPVPLPASPGADNVIAIAIPSTVSPKNSMLEILDNGRGNIARLPVSTTGVAELKESSFTLAQRINVPVQSKGLGVVGAQVTMTNSSKKFSQTRLLQPDDNGLARFDSVPLNEPVSVSVSYGANPAESQTKTLTAARPAEVWPAIVVTWPDAKTVAAPAAPVSSAGPASDVPTSHRSGRAADDNGSASRQPESNPLNSLVSTVISLLFLVAIGYGVWWAYKAGHLKTALDKLGINTAQMETGAAGIPDPFAKDNRAPIQPITEGTADPFAGGVGGASFVAPAVADGPRLVATAGAYSGNIFPLSGPSSDIGRDTANAVALPNDTNASRRHATIQGGGGQFTLVDNGSSNGTFVNGVRVAAQTPQQLRSGDEVQIGQTRFRFEA